MYLYWRGRKKDEKEEEEKGFNGLFGVAAGAKMQAASLCVCSLLQRMIEDSKHTSTLQCITVQEQFRYFFLHNSRTTHCWMHALKTYPKLNKCLFIPENGFGIPEFTEVNKKISFL